MPESTRTPNPATTTRPERSSRKVAHKKPLAWLPLALLALLALLAVLLFAIIRAANNHDDTSTAARPTGQPSASVPTATTPSATLPSSSGAGSSAPGVTGTGTGTAGSGGAAGAPISSTGALVGGAGIAAAPAANAGSTTGTTVAPPAAGTTGTVLFAEGSAQIDSAGQQVIAAAAKNLKSGGAKTVQVVGYTDVKAGTPVNGPLSQQRADAVVAALKPLLPGLTVTASAQGEANPVATNDTDAGRQQNRRVVILGAS